ncbi:MAG: hypothetical protein HYR91_13370 [Flavobacteriia bacterium]|nr:hypothetical protein [Flavobacteriia bacterium]
MIKGLGYKDAFVIAYCDGKRISLAEARDLERSRKCIPKGENELLVEVATNTAEIIEKQIDSTKTNEQKALDELAYNKAVNAVKATPAETRLGLFYTIQIGVYNTPVTAERLKNISPIVSKRLPNGQIRYSSGMFHSVEDAKPKKEEAITRGITDAFITAYYKGERINLNEAKKLLDENGSSILEPLKAEEMNVSSAEQITADIENIRLKEIEERKIEQGKDSILQALVHAEVKQIVYPKAIFVSKKSFTSFPSKELSHYNTLGSFYYDSKDLKIKSAISNTVKELPMLGKNESDFDTLLVVSNHLDNLNIHDFRIAVHTDKMPGDIAEWLIKLNYDREIITEGGELIVFLKNIPLAEVESLKAQVLVFGLNAQAIEK